MSFSHGLNKILFMNRYKKPCHKSSRNECYCKDTPKKPLVSDTGCSNDLAAVLALPDNWTPRHCGSILTNYLQERKNSHQKLLKDLSEKAAAVNKNIEDKLRVLAQILLAHIEDNHKDMQCIVSQLKTKEKTISVEDRNFALKNVTGLYTQRIQDLLKFKLEAHGLERQRADGLRDLLQCEFQKLVAIGHFSPKQLLHDFDEQIYEINQQLLSNSRAYIDLEARLQTQLNENVVRIKSSLNELCLSSSSTLRRRSALPWTRQNGFNYKRSSTTDGRNDHKDTRESIYSKHVSLNLDNFQRCVMDLVEVYRGAITNVYTDFSAHLDQLQHNIGNIDVLNIKDGVLFSLQDMTNKAVGLINANHIQFHEPSQKYLVEMTRNDINKMQDSLAGLGHRLRNTYNILHDASLLWNPHMLRSALAQKLTIAAVEDLETNFDSLELANEVLFNISLELMRGASDVDKIHQQYDFIMNFLEKNTETYFQHNKAEMGKLEDFMNLEPIMSALLLTEYNCFLENNTKKLHQISERKTSTVSKGSPGPLGEQKMFSVYSPLPRALLRTKLQDVALINWRNGFLESFQNNMSVLPSQLSQQSRKWMDNECLLLNMRQSVKLLSLSIRAERIQSARNLRMTELRLHEARLKSHLDAIINVTDSLLSGASEYLALDSPQLYPLCKWIKGIQNNLDELLLRNPLDLEVKRLKMTSYAVRITKHRHLFEESLDIALEQFKKKAELSLQKARISSVQFMSHIKLFSEDGKYSAAEALKTSNALVKGADALESSVNRIFDALHHRRTQLLAMADHFILPLQKVVEEVVKIGGKSQAIDKTKLATSKKK